MVTPLSMSSAGSDRNCSSMLTNMKYVMLHSTIDTDGDVTHQESDGSSNNSEVERQRIQCLQAAIQRRASDRMRVELYVADRRGLLADVMWTLQENGLSVTRAEVAIKDGMVRQ